MTDDLEHVARPHHLPEAHRGQGPQRRGAFHRAQGVAHDHEVGDAGQDGLALEVSGESAAGGLDAEARAPAGGVDRLLHDGQAVEDPSSPSARRAEYSRRRRIALV